MLTRGYLRARTCGGPELSFLAEIEGQMIKRGKKPSGKRKAQQKNKNINKQTENNAET